MSEEIKALQIIPVFDNIFNPNPPKDLVFCKSHRRNPDIPVKNQGPCKEDYTKYDGKEFYYNIITSCDDPYEDDNEYHDVVILTKEEYDILPNRDNTPSPIEIEIKECHEREFTLGIHHNYARSHFYIQDVMQTVAIPQLEFREPDFT